MMKVHEKIIVREKIIENTFKYIFLASALISALITMSIFGFMFFLSLPLLKGGHFFNLILKMWAPYQGTYGIYPMMVGTLSIGFISTALAFPYVL